MWLMLQQEMPDDYVIATNETRTVRDFVETAFAEVNIPLVWRGEGIHEEGLNSITGETLVKINPQFFRPAEVDILLGNPQKAEIELGWERKISFSELVKRMIDNDMKLIKNENKEKKL
jgi:GDPmannose 4,6-dehydratase